MRTAYAVVTALFAALLLVASGLKAQIAFGDGVESFRNGESARHLLPAVTEAAVAAWLLSGVAPAWARRGAIALLCVFVAVAGWHLFRGDPDCGCFGHVRVRPGLTLAIDAVALASIWVFGRSESPPPGAQRRGALPRPAASRVVLSVLAGTGVPAFVALFASEWAASAPSGIAGDLVGADGPRPVLLAPRDWAGKRFPLLDEVMPSETDLSKGRWVLILVNHDCHTCEEYLAHANFDAIRRTDGPDAPPRRIGLIEFLTKESDEPKKVPGPVAVTTLRLRPGTTYLTDGPYEVYLSDGVVEQARRVIPRRGG
jgi:hypothetical protein